MSEDVGSLIGGLSPRRKRFVVEYLANGHNGREAVVAAGYSTSNPEERARCLLKRDDVRAVIRERSRRQALAADVDQPYIVERLRAIVEDESERGAVRVRALELLGRWLGMFDERVQHLHRVTLAERAGMTREAMASSLNAGAGGAGGAGMPDVLVGAGGADPSAEREAGPVDAASWADVTGGDDDPSA